MKQSKTPHPKPPNVDGKSRPQPRRVKELSKDELEKIRGAASIEGPHP